MSEIVFKPWIGKDYESGGIFRKKILVLGESHYGYTDESFATNDVVSFVVSGGTAEWTGTFRKFERSLVGHYTDTDESKKIWNSVAFYNYIQKSMDQSRQSPSDVDFTNSENAFFEVLSKLNPDLIIAWGRTRMFDKMPGKGWTYGGDIRVNGQSEYALSGVYELENHKKIPIIWVNHPASGYSWDKWYNVISQVL